MIKILHLYPDLLDLNGDAYNVKAIVAKLAQMGIEAEISYYNSGENISEEYDMYYIGHGKTKNFEFAANDFLRHKEHMLKEVESGKVFFVTGNARLFFGKSYEKEDKTKTEGIALFDYTTEEIGDCYPMDVVAKTIEGEHTVYGFINRTAHIKGENTSPLFKVLIGTGDDDVPSQYEGNHYKNYFGTWLVGPVLVRNPQVLKLVLRALAKDKYKELDFSKEEEALRLTLKEFNM